MERSKNRSIDRHRKRPAANTSSLITAKRVGILAVVGLGLFGTYKLSESEPTESTTKRPVAEKIEENHEGVQLPLSATPEQSEELDKIAKRKELFRKFLEELQKYSSSESDKVDITTHFRYLEELISENEKVPRHTIKNPIDRRASGNLKRTLKRLMDWQENGHLNNEEWQEIADIINSFNEDELGEWAQGLNSHTYTLRPKLVTIEKTDFWLNYIHKLTTISPSDGIGTEIGLVRRSEWESLLNMPTNSDEEAELKFQAAMALAHTAEIRCKAFNCEPAIDISDWDQ